jgi:hypothetical protein
MKETTEVVLVPEETATNERAEERVGEEGERNEADEVTPVPTTPAGVWEEVEVETKGNTTIGPRVR